LPIKEDWSQTMRLIAKYLSLTKEYDRHHECTYNIFDTFMSRFALDVMHIEPNGLLYDIYDGGALSAMQLVCNLLEQRERTENYIYDEIPYSHLRLNVVSGELNK
jgi:hypothetical protein